MIRSDDTPETTEPCCRRTIVSALRSAAVELYGEPGLQALGARMTPDCKRLTIDAVQVPSIWLPERLVIEWYQVVYGGPAKAEMPAFNRYLDKMIDHGFGRVRKALLNLLTPPKLLEKARDLWRHDHTHGIFKVDIKPNSAIITLREHPYVADDLSRAAIAEIYRHCVNLSRTKVVSEKHAFSDGVLQVDLAWS